MHASEFQTEVERTMNPQANRETALANYALGIAGEAGEVADFIKKTLYHGHPLDVDKLMKECFDVMWYAAAICSVLGVPLSDALRAGIEKLRKRYPNGFSTEASIARVDTTKP